MSIQNKPRDKWRHRVLELTVFAMLGTLMFCSKIVMEFLPNVHLVGAFTMAFTLIFRAKALIPIYVYVLLVFIVEGINVLVAPYLYVWALLWGITMLLPKNMPAKIGIVIYPVICSLHGFLFGILCAPAEALFFGLDFNGMISWIAAGSVFDITHGIGNFIAGFLIVPLVKLMNKLVKGMNI